MFKKIKRKYILSSIATKIRTVFLILFILIILIESYTSGILMKNIILEDTKETIMRNISQTELTINNLETTLNLVSNETMLNINNLGPDSLDINERDDSNALSTLLRQNVIFYKMLSSITYVLNNGDYFSSLGTRKIWMVGQIPQSPVFKSLKESNVRSGFMYLNGKDSISESEKDGQLYYVKEVRSISDLSIKGWILMEIDLDALAESISINPTYNSVILYIDNQEILYTGDLNHNFDKVDISSLKKNKSGQILSSRIENNDYFYSLSQVKNFNVVMLSSKELYKQSIQKMILNIIIISVIFGIIVLFVIQKLAQSISNPIKKFTHHIEKDKESRITEYHDDVHGEEVEILINEFNLMVKSNEKLLKENKLKEQKKKEYELALYQSQLNPHFLYNTLDVIIRLIALKKNKIAMSITKDIADFYRTTLSGGAQVIEVKSEIELTQKYLIIQQTRYPDILFFDIKIDPKIEKYLIPKLSIQPLVENAIYHGIKPKRSEGVITIKGYEDEEYYYLSVVDDGVGMDKEVQKRLNRKDKTIGNTKSYGVINVQERLKLYFGNRASMDIQSEKNKGSKVVLSIPKEIFNV